MPYIVCDFLKISDDEKLKVLQDLMASAGRNSTTADTNEYFKVCLIFFDNIQ